MLPLEYISTHGARPREWCAARMSARESKGRLPAYRATLYIMHRRMLALRVARGTHSSWLSIPVTLLHGVVPAIAHIEGVLLPYDTAI